MLSQPKNTKFRKQQRSFKKRDLKSRDHRLAFGCYGLKSLECGQLKASQLESVRRVIIRRVRKIGKIWIRAFPYKPVSAKPTKTRMGKGKGSVQYWVCPIQPGQVIIELSGSFSEEIAKETLNLASQKLPVITKFVKFDSACV